MSAGEGDIEFAPDLPVEPLHIATLDEFVAIEEPGAAALLGGVDEALIPEGGDVMLYGDGGAGKTTLSIDLACHLAAGNDWLGIPVARPLRVLLVENEGPRPLFRAKLRRKRDGWQGSALGDRVLVVEAPWAQTTFDDPDCQRALAATIDVAVVGPVTRSGMHEAGTLQEVRDFMQLVHAVRKLAGRAVAFVLVHHENKGGQVSGAWEGAGDTLLHVQPQGHGRTRLYVQKARWSSHHHATTLHLLWAEGEAFALKEKPELDDETLAEMILAAVRENPGTTWTSVEKETPGVGRETRRKVRDGLFAAGSLLNIVMKDGQEVALDRCPERTPSRLFLADDPAIAHLRPDSGAAQAQAAPAGGARESASLRRAPRPIRGAGVAAQAGTPAEPADEALDELLPAAVGAGHITPQEASERYELHQSLLRAEAQS